MLVCLFGGGLLCLVLMVAGYVVLIVLLLTLLLVWFRVLYYSYFGFSIDYIGVCRVTGLFVVLCVICISYACCVVFVGY